MNIDTLSNLVKFMFFFLISSITIFINNYYILLEQISKIILY